MNDSYKVTSRYDRQKISMILSRTEGVSREYDNLSSEWLLHNVGYTLKINTESSKDVNLDYVKDSRWSVNALSKTLEILGWD